ncbi:MAG TPA: hypothetical protein VJV78_36045 [Polyangiales bacterium]|nr:hypothetical protein [Polyangiales bacterium]
MGLFDYPRIHIFGQHEVNPGTGNNNSASPGDELTVTSDSERVEPIGNKSDAEFRQWMMELDELGALRSQWNYYGDMSFRFTSVTVGSVQLDPERLISDAEHDRLIGASVHLNNAIVCDNNPEGFNGTQVFAEALEIHAPDALEGAGSFVSRPPDRATTRWLNWQRNVSFQTPFTPPRKAANGEITSGAAGGASATFQCGIPLKEEDLVFDVGDERRLERSRFKLLPKAGSPALQALVAAIRGGARGLLFRYNLYLCYPRISDSALFERFKRGERPCNPARGELIGTISPWYPDREPSTITMGRLLQPAAAYPNAYRPDKRYHLSPAVAVHDQVGQRLSIDLANCLPEDGPEGDKYNLGEVTIGIRSATPPGKNPEHNAAEIHTLGTLTNDRETYRKQGGIYDMPLTAAGDAARWLGDPSHELVLHSSLYGVLLYEPEYMLASDCSCNYLDELAPDHSWDDADVRAELEREPHAALRGKVDLWLLRRGQRPTADVRVKVEEWRQTPTGYAQRYGEYRYPALLSRRELSMQERTNFELAPSPGAGVRMYRFVPEHNWPQDVSERDIAERAIQESIVELRVLPHDDYSHVRDDELTLELIYRTVFRYYDLVTPAMSQAMDLTDASIWQMPAAARYVLLTTSSALWGSWQYMPRTRDLSRSRRQLLERFCRAMLLSHGQE